MVSSRSENNTIRVSVKNTTNVTKANASSINSSNPVNASNNQAKMYEQQALAHANTSKYWAEQSETSALKSENYAKQSELSANSILQNEKFIAVSENLDNINTVGENIENVITIAEDLDVVADSLDVINNVNDNLDVITSVNSNVENINTVASNIEDIQNAEENSNIAKEKAQESFNYSELSKHYSEVSKEQADIATSKTNEVVEKGNTAITEIEALGNEKIDVITVQTKIAITKASEASQSASNALKSSQNSALSEANAKESENKAKTSETNALNSANVATQQAQIAKEEVAKLSTVYKYKGSVATINNLPTNANVGDVYDTQETGMNYAWNGTEWDELGGTFDVSWGSLKGSISDNADLQNSLNTKANNNEVVHLSNTETITGKKTFTQPIKIQNGAGTGSLLIGGDVNAGTVTNGARKLARIAVPTQANKDLTSILLGFDSNGDDALNITNRGSDNIAFGGSKKITNATSPMSISFCVAKERNATDASKKTYALEMDANEARFNSRPNYNGVNLATTVDITNALNGYAKLSDIPDVTNFITMADVESKGYLTEVPSEYVTETELSTFAYDKATVDGKIADAVTGGTVDLSGYAKIEDLVFDWIGTKSEYETGYANGTIQNDWMCYITDDEQDFLAEYIPTLQVITQAEYDALTVKNANTLYLIEE